MREVPPGVRVALRAALDEAERQLHEMGPSEARNDEDLGWSFDGPGDWYCNVVGEHDYEVVDGVLIVRLTAYANKGRGLRRWRDSSEARVVAVGG